MTKKYAFVIVGNWSILFLLTLPFSYAVLPSLGKFITETLLPFYNWISLSFFGIDGAVYYASSDSIVGFIQAGVLLLLSAFVSPFIFRSKRLHLDSYSSVLHQVLAFLVALFLLKYGIDKLLLHQFYPPEPNTLFTPTGMLSKDILFWSTMGSSKTYNLFMGLIEVIPGLLLFHRKTRMLGAFISIGVFTNVFFLNIGFDITVKLLSLMLLVASVVLFAPYFSRFSEAFFGKTANQHQINISFSPTKRSSIIKGIALLLITAETISPYISLNYAKNDQFDSIIGSYEVISVQGDSHELPLNDLRRIHLHSKGYWILENQDATMHDFPFHFNPSTRTIAVKSLKIKLHQDTRSITFNWMEQAHEIKIRTKKIDLNQLPLRQDNTHLTLEGMLQSGN